MRTILRLLVVGLAGTALLAAGFSPVAVTLAQSGAVSISTDKSQYQIGDTLRVCYTVAGPGPVTITDIQADGTTHTLLSAVDDGTGWCFAGTVTPPTGTECLRLDASSSVGRESSRTCFHVVNLAPPPGRPCIQIYPPPPGCGGSITTDQAQYSIGMPIRICYTVPGPGPVMITDIEADGTTHSLLSGVHDGTGGCLAGTVTPPAGTECLRLDYATAAGSGSPQTCFQVTGPGASGCVAPVRTASVGDNGGTVTLHVGECFGLALDAGDTWTVMADDASMLACDSGPLPPNAQGTCTAVRAGTTTVRATGTPTCYPACLRPSLLFLLTVTVQP